VLSAVSIAIIIADVFGAFVHFGSKNRQ
jgi:hypothetical protein